MRTTPKLSSKKAAGRAKDVLDMPLMESFAKEYRKLFAKPLRSSFDLVKEAPEEDGPVAS